MNSKISILDTGYESYAYEENLFRESGYSLAIYDGPGQDSEQKIRFASGSQGILVRLTRIGSDELDRLPGLKAIVRYGVGYDNIDIPAAKERGIRVANVQGYGNHSVSDHAMALMFSCARDVEGSRAGNFGTPSRRDVLEFHDKTLGIIGIGRIGSHFSRKASPLFNRTLACDPYKESAYMEPFGAAKVSLDELLRQSHVISIHCNLTGETRHMLDQGAFSQMDKRPVVVNTARGPVIDETALFRALEEDRVHSAGLDVFENEPYGEAQARLLEHPRVVYSPHIAWYSEYSNLELQQRAARNLVALLNGESVEDEL